MNNELTVKPACSLQHFFSFLQIKLISFHYFILFVKEKNKQDLNFFFLVDKVVEIMVSYFFSVQDHVCFLFLLMEKCATIKKEN